MTDFRIQMNNYYFDKLLAYQKVLENTNNRIPLCLVIAKAIKDYFNKNFEFDDIDRFEYLGVQDSDTIRFEYSSKHFNYSSNGLLDKKYSVYMNRDFHITQIRITDNNTDRVELEKVSYVGDFRLENTGKLYVPNGCKIKVNLKYILSIGRKTIGATILGATILDESEEFRMFELMEADNYAVYHYLAEDPDLNQNIGILIIPSVYSYYENSEN